MALARLSDYYEFNIDINSEISLFDLTVPHVLSIFIVYAQIKPYCLLGV